MPKIINKAVLFEHLGPRLALLTALAAAAAAVLLGSGAAREALDRHVAWPTELWFADAIGRAPTLAPRLKVFAMDDSTFAGLRRPALSGDDWAAILRKLARSRPGGIYTSHMFGAGELEDDDGALATALADLAQAGVPVFAAAFPYPARISHRDPIPLERAGLTPEVEITSRAYLGHLLYGPPPADAGRFAGIGHIVYEADGRLRAFLRLSDDKLVPHLSLVGVAARTKPASLPLDDEGRLRFALLPAATLGDSAKSLRSLLQDPEAPSRHVGEGDVVLILTDMYTGRVSFVPTALGPMPGGYVVASTLNAALSGGYPAPLPLGLPLAALTAAALTALGALTTGYLFAAVAILATAAVVLAGLGLYAYTASYAPWLPAALAGLAGAGVVNVRRAAARLSGERDRSLRSEREKARLGAIVRTAQMFAHDVRKPFSMLRMAVEAVQREGDPAKSHALFSRLFPELASAMAAVEGMIQDVTEIDAEARLSLEPIAIERLLERTLEEVFLLRQGTQVQLLYDLQHTLDVAVDASKIRRALVNIVDNAVEAMQGNGRIWFHTRDVVEGDRTFVELTIGNSGTFIPPDVRERVFEAFFTAGKKGGTGLGLAIAHKAVTTHGGRIACESTQERGTAFVLTLPTVRDTPRERQDHGLPASAEALASQVARRAAHLAPPPDDAALAAAAGEALAALARPLPVMIVDDEAFYRDELTATLLALVPSGRLEIMGAADAATALALWRERSPGLVLCDVDLGPGTPNGFEIVAGIKRTGAGKALVVVHSNRVLPADARSGEAAGADAFLPKPAPRARLLELLRDAAKLRRARGDGPATSGARPLLAVVDDSPFTLEAWKLLVKDAEVLTFESPTAFWSATAADLSLLARLSCLVTDFYFDNEIECTGVDFAVAVKARRADLPVYLSSNAELDDVPGDTLDGCIGKEPASYHEIAARARKVG